MASEAQIAANRATAARGTGPRTARGKARSSRNALKHDAFASERGNAITKLALRSNAPITARFTNSKPAAMRQMPTLSSLPARPAKTLALFYEINFFLTAFPGSRRS